MTRHEFSRSLVETPMHSAEEASCPTCGSVLVQTKDAIGRVRDRCPMCQGVAPTPRIHPDDAFMPQGLVRVRGGTLPAIAPGQLRCQVCAYGVEGMARFCDRCAAKRAEKDHGATTCTGCGRTRAREAHEWRTTSKCEQCDHAKTQLCLGCNRVSPRPKWGRLTTKDCLHCMPRKHGGRQ